jgi:hypothetical protein
MHKRSFIRDYYIISREKYYFQKENTLSACYENSILVIAVNEFETNTTGA